MDIEKKALELVGRLQLGDLAAIPEAVTALQSLTATAREAEALRAENARLREALGLIIENEGPDTGYGNSSAKIARAALKGSQQ